MAGLFKKNERARRIPEKLAQYDDEYLLYCVESLLILDAGATMLKKMKKKPQPRIIAGCAFVIMLLGNLFSLRISSVALMLAAGIISLSVFAAKSAPAQRGGAGQ